MRETIHPSRVVSGFALGLVLVLVLGGVSGCARSTPSTSATAAVATTAPPSLESIQKVVGEAIQGVRVVGLHKLREGAYLVITDTPAANYGGPYQLLRLESGEWMLGLQMTFGDKYVKVAP